MCNGNHILLPNCIKCFRLMFENPMPQSALFALLFVLCRNLIQTDCSVLITSEHEESLAYLDNTIRLPGKGPFRVHSHLRFIRRDLLCERTIRYIMGCTILSGRINTSFLVNFCLGWKVQNGLWTHFSQLCGLKSSCNNSRLINHKCDWPLDGVSASMVRCQ